LRESVCVSAQATEVKTNRRNIESKYDAVGQGFPVDVKIFIVFSSLIVKPIIKTQKVQGVFQLKQIIGNQELFY
jgi:hypothetical protein